VQPQQQAIAFVAGATALAALAAVVVVLVRL
jgi:hypothetical protein